jgi:protein-L-isoaspartate(D-aspartate) O-methyltransferase
MFVDKNKISAFYNKLDRSFFMEDNKKFARIDAPFSIGYGQTISQPSLVLYMTLLLELEEESKVLEIGTGSGYQSALLAEFSKELYTVEVIEPLYLKAKERLKKLGYKNISYKIGNGSLGWIEEAPFDRIMVTAAATTMPNALIEQLAPNGRMVIPVGEFWQRLIVVTKDEDGNVEYIDDIAVRFVRLV